MNRSIVRSSRWVRAVIAGLCGGLAWLAGIILFFGPAQAILTDPALQSAKFLAIFTTDPPPRISGAPWLLPAGLLGIGVLWGCAYARLAAAWSGTWWRRGLQFGGMGWLLMAPWFEFYLPWNALLEPAPLVALELVCWAAVLCGVGVTIAGVDAALAGRSRSSIPRTGS